MRANLKDVRVVIHGKSYPVKCSFNKQGICYIIPAIPIGDLVVRRDCGNAIIGLTEIEQACNAYELFQR